MAVATNGKAKAQTIDEFETTAISPSRAGTRFAGAPDNTVVTIAPPNIQSLELRIISSSPYVQARFSAKAMQAMKTKQAAGSTSRKGAKREARDFDADFRAAQHVSTDGWIGIPASAFRNACISACRLVGFKMTMAKLSLFIEADGLDEVDGIPLVKLDAPKPERTDMAVRNATGVVDIRVRPMWRTWGAKVRIRYDADQFTVTDVVNLMWRAGAQVGIGEGRPDSKESAGMGFGLFSVERGAK